MDGLVFKSGESHNIDSEARAEGRIQDGADFDGAVHDPQGREAACVFFV
jgi:hypothetical protein